MNFTWKCVPFLGFFLTFVGICAISIPVNAIPTESDKLKAGITSLPQKFTGPLFGDVILPYALENTEQTPKLIEVEAGDNLTLPCHPALENSTQILTGQDFEWVTLNDLPLYSNGRLSPFLFLYDINNDSVAVDHSTLIIRWVPYTNENITITCRLIHLHVNFTYIVQVNRRKIYDTSQSTIIHSLEPPYYEKSVVLTCRANENRSSSNTSYMWVRRRNKQNRSFIEVISLNQRILARNNSFGFRIAENKSLIISNYKSTPQTEYKCYSSNGPPIIHHVVGPFDQREDVDDETDENQIDGSSTEPETLVVNFGARDLILSCPVANHSEYEWIAKTWGYIYGPYPDVLILNGENFTPIRQNSRRYEVNEDGSLVIRIVIEVAFGTYTCRNRISGELYVYNITRKTDVKPNRNISAKQETNVTLPCPMNHPNDRELSLVTWNLMLRDVSYSLDFAEGKLISSFSSPFYLADDKGSLIISNFHSGLIGNYTCFLRYSGTVYSYTLELEL